LVLPQKQTQKEQRVREHKNFSLLPIRLATGSNLQPIRQQASGTSSRNDSRSSGQQQQQQQQARQKEPKSKKAVALATADDVGVPPSISSGLLR
jgi:hypothetical protein